MIRALLLYAARAALTTERGLWALELVATTDPAVGRYLLERLAGHYGAKLEMDG
jgi:hypothetical protein